MTRKGERRGVHKLLVGNPEGKRPLGGPSVDERTILNLIFKKYGWEAWTGLFWLRIRIGSGRL